MLNAKGRSIVRDVSHSAFLKESVHVPITITQKIVLSITVVITSTTTMNLVIENVRVVNTFVIVVMYQISTDVISLCAFDKHIALRVIIIIVQIVKHSHHPATVRMSMKRTTHLMYTHKIAFLTDVVQKDTHKRNKRILYSQ